MKVYKIYLKNNKTDSILYIKAIIWNAEGELKLIPAYEKEDAGIYEEDKANAYIKLLTEQRPDNSCKFCLEEIDFN